MNSVRILNQILMHMEHIFLQSFTHENETRRAALRTPIRDKLEAMLVVKYVLSYQLYMEKYSA